MVMGNWKMNGCLTEATVLLQEMRTCLSDQRDGACVVFPPAIYLPLAQSILSGSPIQYGAQNLYPKVSGAYTGELSAIMLNDFGCRYVLVGHSERRRLFHEDEKFIAEKFHHVKDHDMIPVLCIGETLDEREKGLTNTVLAQQLLSVTQISTRAFQNCVVAYEPVWAIGTGQTALPEQVQSVHALIREWVAKVDETDAGQLPILYGGSVNEKNARSLFDMPDVDGGLVGGASLHAQQFVEIVECINCY
jgi:triosephosphate isomerase